MTNHAGRDPEVDTEEVADLLHSQANDLREQFRSLPSVAELLPRGVSVRIQRLEEGLSPVPIREPIVRHMTVSKNCLQRAGPALTKPYAEHSLFMLLRGAVENAALCEWLLVEDDVELMRRVLANRAAEILEEKKFNKLFGACDKSYQAPQGLQQLNDRKLDEVLQISDRLGFSENDVVSGKRKDKVRKYTLSDIMKSLGEVNGINVFSTWSIASGLAHGGGHIASAIKEMVAEGLHGEPVGYKPYLALGQASTAAHLYVIAYNKYASLLQS